LKLEKLDIFGFKSFAERTVFEFEDELTALVGPNGSGKSNVVDALKWVLGERSARKLRGTEMTNVIFNGSTGPNGRKPLNFATVTLTIDNSDGWLPVEYEQVAIRRRIDRTGQSEYFINGKKCRLKDIRNLLMDTGVGTTSYSFIEQGQVTRLLTADANERRAVFEEAAGINRFLDQKREAERKLERVADNLARSGDILEELQRQLRSVKYQAGRARTFRKHAQRLERLRLASALHSVRTLTDELEQRRRQVAAAGQQKDRLTEAAARAAAQLEDARAELQAAQNELADRRQQLTRLDVRLEGLAREAELNHRRGEELQHQIDELRQRRKALEERAAGLARDQAAAARDLEAAVEALKSKSAEHEALRRQIEAARARCQAAEKELEAKKTAVFDLFQRESRLRSHLEVLAGERQTLENRLERLGNRRRELEGQIETARAERAVAQQRLQELQGRHQQMIADMARLRENIAESARELDAISSRLGEARAQLSGKLGRRDVLLDLERRAEGVRSGVRKLTEARLPGALGLVAELVAVPLEHAAAVEAALGDRAQAVVFDTAEHARAALDLLARDGCGRAELLVLDCMASPPEAQPPADEAVVRRLTDLIEWRAGIGPAVRFLLGNAFLVADDAAAARLAGPALPAGVRLVTPSGQCFGADGLWAAGEPETPSLISRRSELAELAREIAALEAKTADLNERKAACAGSLRRLDRERDDLALHIETMNRELADLRGLIDLVDRRTEDLDEDIRLGRAESTAIQRDLRSLEQKRSGLEQQLLYATGERTEAQQSIETRQAELRAVQEETRTLAEKANALGGELAGIRERHGSLRHLLQRIETDRRRTTAELAGLGAEQKANTERRAHARAAVEAAEAEGQKLRGAKDALASDLSTREVGLEALRDTIGALGERCRRLANDREQIEERLHGLQLAENETRIKKDDLIERTAEDLGVRLLALELDPEQWRRTPPFTVRRIREFTEGEDAVEQPEAVASWYSEMEREEPQIQEDEDRPAEGHEVVGLEEAVALRDAVLETADAHDTDWPAVAEEIARLRARVARIGNVDVNAIGEQERLELRVQFLTDQRDDLEAARRHEREIIRELNNKSRERFRETFERVRENFRRLFRKLFGGGNADIILDEEAKDILEAGIEMVARPPGKENNAINLLSGGEKALTTVALLFAMFQAKPSPFCLLDEVDAPLDDSNVERFLMMLEEFKANTQFIVITHNKLTMSAAQVLYGLTMAHGVSQQVSVRFEDVEHNAPTGKADLARAG